MVQSTGELPTSLAALAPYTITNFGQFDIRVSNAQFTDIDISNESGGTINLIGTGNQFFPGVLTNKTGGMVTMSKPAKPFPATEAWITRAVILTLPERWFFQMDHIPMKAGISPAQAF
jgi:hypothetical protein